MIHLKKVLEIVQQELQSLGEGEDQMRETLERIVRILEEGIKEGPVFFERNNEYLLLLLLQYGSWIASFTLEFWEELLDSFSEE